MSKLEIRSPLPGTFYRKPSPDAAPYKADGDSVAVGDVIGLIEVMWSAYFTIDYKDVAAFTILAIVLVFMPSGLLGRPEVEKV